VDELEIREFGTPPNWHQFCRLFRDIVLAGLGWAWTRANANIVDDSRSGFIIDGLEITPFVGAILSGVALVKIYKAKRKKLIQESDWRMTTKLTNRKLRVHSQPREIFRAD
jgi:hypothetical protein